MSTDKKRVQFPGPNRLIGRADALAAVLGEDRTDVLVTALREYLQNAAHDDAPLRRSPPPITTRRSPSSSSSQSACRGPRRRQTSEC